MQPPARPLPLITRATWESVHFAHGLDLSRQWFGDRCPSKPLHVCPMGLDGPGRVRATEPDAARRVAMDIAAAIRWASTIQVAPTSPRRCVRTGAAAVVIVGVTDILAVAVLRPPSGPAPAVMPGIGEGSGAGGVKATPDWADPMRSALKRLADDPKDPEGLVVVREQVRAAILQGRPIAEFQKLQTYATALKLDVDLIQLHAEFQADVDGGTG